MPTPLSPSSSQEIIPISPPTSSIIKKGSFVKSKSSKSLIDLSESLDFKYNDSENDIPSSSSKNEKQKYDSNQINRKNKTRITSSTHWSKKDLEDNIKRKAIDNQREELNKKSRFQITQRMLSTRGKDLNPITNSDLYSRTDHFVSCSTGHQQSNRGGGSEGSMTYWQVRSAQVNDQARTKQTDILKGCLIYLNGSSGPKLSNLQMQHLISSNGGRIAPLPSSSCTHVIANGGLSGSKTQKHIDGQGKRGASRRPKVVKVEWLLDSIQKGQRLSEAGYGMVDDPSQPNLFKTLGVKPKAESELAS
ncbi:uncharacterized protein I206_103279 [Kwoniella pini CBS 10737]|uniref:BRCT domain-containing protein n=1 Tax=Kwoniella pini CBS 10737 TaxID=1296096 RepID=A0A1B9I9Z7_9TREE|nr:uncharacterized protein I206_01715 [Kwoniella pini CBS 10737]OCF52425.1 hypothetical protein I206_01715 [Kwoniella pini CBS 10737]